MTCGSMCSVETDGAANCAVPLWTSFSACGRGSVASKAIMACALRCVVLEQKGNMVGAKCWPLWKAWWSGIRPDLARDLAADSGLG